MKFYENKFYSRHNPSLSASDPGTKFNLQNYNSEHENQLIITTEQYTRHMFSAQNDLGK